MIENIDPSSMLSGYSVYRASYTDELQAKAAAIGESLPTFRPIRYQVICLILIVLLFVIPFLFAGRVDGCFGVQKKVS